MVIEDYEPNLARKFKLGPDIVEECEAVSLLTESSQPLWRPIFEPIQFNEEHGPLTIEDYRLSQDQLQ